MLHSSVAEYTFPIEKIKAHPACDYKKCAVFKCEEKMKIYHRRSVFLHKYCCSFKFYVNFVWYIGRRLRKAFWMCFVGRTIFQRFFCALKAYVVIRVKLLFNIPKNDRFSFEKNQHARNETSFIHKRQKGTWEFLERKKRSRTDDSRAS